MASILRGLAHYMAACKKCRPAPADKSHKMPFLLWQRSHLKWECAGGEASWPDGRGLMWGGTHLKIAFHWLLHQKQLSNETTRHSSGYVVLGFKVKGWAMKFCFLFGSTIRLYSYTFIQSHIMSYSGTLFMPSNRSGGRTIEKLPLLKAETSSRFPKQFVSPGPV